MLADADGKKRVLDLNLPKLMLPTTEKEQTRDILAKRTRRVTKLAVSRTSGPHFIPL